MSEFLWNRMFQTDSWKETRDLILTQPLYLSPDMNDWITSRLATADDEEQRTALVVHQQLLGLCNLQDIDEVFTELIGPLDEAILSARLFQDETEMHPAQGYLYFFRIMNIIDFHQQAVLAAVLLRKMARYILFSNIGDLQENRRQAILHLRTALEFVTRSQHPEEWAMTQDILASLYYLDQGANYSENIEKAIQCYHELLTYWTRTSNPMKWAETTRRLALSFSARIQGSRIENIEESIRLFREALTQYSKSTTPEDWATANTYLGQSYLSRGMSDPEENIDTAISLLEEALSVREDLGDQLIWCETAGLLCQALRKKNRGSRAERSSSYERAIAMLQQVLVIQEELIFNGHQKMHISEWLSTKDQLAQAYRVRIQGNQQDNLRMAAKHWRDALSYLSEKADAFAWAGFLQDHSSVLIDIEDGNRTHNIEEAIQGLERAMRIRSRELTPENWAYACCSLAHAYANRFQGDRAENLAKGLTYRQTALEILTFESFPNQWVETMIQVGIHYADQLKGDREESIDSAIACYHRVLNQGLAYLRPEIEAKTLMQLGNALVLRRRGSRAENLKQAKGYFDQGLALIEPQEHPLIWAHLTQNLASLYLNHLEGDEVQNREKAARLYKDCLEVLTFEKNPVDWSICKRNLALYYTFLETGDNAHHAAQAVEILEEVLERLNPDTYEDDWLETQLALAKALRSSTGDPTANLEQAIEITRLVFEREGLREKNPKRWLDAGLTLAENYRLRLRGDHLQNQTQAMMIAKECLDFLDDLGREVQPGYWIQAMMMAIKIAITWEGEGHIEKKEEGLLLCQRLRKDLSPESYPMEYLDATAFLANAWSWRYKGDQEQKGHREQNFEKAIDLYDSVLQQLDHQKYPVRWAETLNHLAGAYRDRRLGDKDQNHAKSAMLYRQALTVFTLDQDPASYHLVMGNLGRLYFADQEWAKALEAFERMLHAADILYQTAPTQEARRAHLRANVDLPARAAFCLAKLSRFQEAIVLLERRRTQTLAELLDEGGHEQAPEIASLKQEIFKLESRLRLLKDSDQAAYIRVSKKLSQIRSQLLEGYPSYGADAELSYEDIQDVARTSGKALVYISVPWLGGFALIVTSSDEVEDSVVWLDGALGPDLRSMLHNYDEDKAVGYLQAFGDVIKHPDFLDEITSYAAANIMEPVIQRLTSQNVDEAVLIPLGFLGLLPLHAFGSQDIIFSYAPSCRLLRRGLARYTTLPDESLLALGENRTLENAALEVHFVADAFQDKQVFTGPEADLHKLAAFSERATHVHLACHGVFELANPIASKIQLSNEEGLSLNALLDGTIHFDQTRLIFLSACETGVIDFRTVPDENIGFPVGFLLQGIPGVVSTLWKVDDLATLLLSRKFYELLLHEESSMSPAKALHLARYWLRDLPFEEIEAYYEETKASFESTEALKVKITHFGNEILLNPEKKPFEHPRFWASFILNGL